MGTRTTEREDWENIKGKWKYTISDSGSQSAMDHGEGPRASSTGMQKKKASAQFKSPVEGPPVVCPEPP